MLYYGKHEANSASHQTFRQSPLCATNHTVTQVLGSQVSQSYREDKDRVCIIYILGIFPAWMSNTSKGFYLFLVSRGTGYSTVLEGWNAARIKHDDGSGWFGIVTVHMICHSAFVTFANAFNRDKFSRQWTLH